MSEGASEALPPPARAEAAAGLAGRGPGVDPTVLDAALTVVPGILAGDDAKDGPRDFGRYRILEELGRGGMGVVYRAHDQTLGRDVALKVLQVAGRIDAETLGRFEREARAAAALDHPNIVRVHDVGTLPNGAPYYTMEMLSGQDLAHAIAEGRLATREAVEAVRQVSLALLYAHQKGVLHRDLKPQNIFLRRVAASPSSCGAPTRGTYVPPLRGNETTARVPSTPREEIRALLLDFGLAKLSERDLAAHAEGTQGRKSMQSLTRSGEIIGTPAYMPPEQTHGAKDVDARADIYSLGAALYHGLAGRPPFDAPSLAGLLSKVQHQDPSPPSRSNADIDPDLDTLTLKCLQKDPKDRYQDAGELAEDLGRWLAGDPISARPIGLAGRLWRKAKRNRPVAMLVAMLALCVVGTIAWFGGGAAVRAWRLAGLRAAYDHAMTAKEFDRAAAAAEQGQGLAPNDARWRERGATALYERSAVQGRSQLAAWRAHRDESERLELAGKASSPDPATEGETGRTPAQRDSRRAARWMAEKALGAETLAREDAWSKASVAFTEALTHLTSKEAEDALTELYLDRYLRAERDRDRAAMGAYESFLIQFGKEAYEQELRGLRDVHVRFWLPLGFAPHEVTAYLSEYRPCDWPPVLVPVPYDLAQGRALRSVVERLTEDDAGWKPVPLVAALSGESPVVATVRSKSLFEPRCLDENRLRLVVGREGSRPYVELDLRLPRGSFLLSIAPGQGLLPIRYPFEVAREFPWKEECEIPAESDVPPRPPSQSPYSSAYWVYVPAGPYRASGDPKAQQNPPRDAAVVRLPEGRPVSEAGPSRDPRGFYIARFEVTCPMYLAYLNDRAWHRRCSPACGDWGHVPRKSIDAQPQTAYWSRNASGEFSFPQGMEEWHVFAVSWNDATDYCRWLTATRGNGLWEFVLPSEDEWEKAARGPDGRFHPWGDSFDDTFCGMAESRPGEQAKRNPEPVGLFPVDEGPSGVRDVGGGVYEWTRTVGGGGAWRVTKGGAWGGPSWICRCAGRGGPAPEHLTEAIGFRVAGRRVP